ncbi:hypothetical protein NA56DRAFT_648290 [Hyaloscypha hepaticicola]|uniref:Uncharacterized protein n=1 Tax=Hyaloscypha hepaticicola TaxID=2082293 RepID=A0A2J6PV66_9HELO|nr:hypothetical protein NA56DRAFT_648290 [Hyaloscypha hepaticicola]
MPEENPITTNTNNPPSLNPSTSPPPPDSQDQAAPQQKSNVHKKLEAFLHAQKQSMTGSTSTSTSTPKATSSEGQAQPFDGENPGGLVSLPEKEGDARDERVSGSDDSGVGKNVMS